MENLTEIQKIASIAKNQNLEIEIYKTKFNAYKNAQTLHTDTCHHVDINIVSLTDEDIADWAILSAEDYNNTINANCGAQQYEDTIIVVLNNN